MRGDCRATLRGLPAREGSRPRDSRWGPALPLIGAVLWGCAHTSHTVAPYRGDPVAALAVEDRAQASCLEHSSELPPRPFVTDGCTAFVNDGWTGCCVEHDIAYWCGGSAAERKRADRRLERCVADLGHPFLARLMYLGVRVGAPAWIPAHWRWGFGWRFPYACDHEDGPASANGSGASPDTGSVR
jgi:hypothetical protein